jgi:DNA-binding GntR family transcriptional regulator
MRFVPGSRTEVREALVRLTEEGLLHRSPRHGTRLEATPIPWSLTRGMAHPERHTVSVDELAAPRRIAPAEVLSAAFGRELESLWQRDEVFTVDGGPICLRSSYWDRGTQGRPVILPDTGTSLARSVELAYDRRFGKLESSLSALTADSRQSAVLGVPVGEPLLWRQTVIADEAGEIIEISHSFYVGSRVFFDLPAEDSHDSLRNEDGQRVPHEARRLQPVDDHDVTGVHLSHEKAAPRPPTRGR